MGSITKWCIIRQLSQLSYLDVTQFWNLLTPSSYSTRNIFAWTWLAWQKTRSTDSVVTVHLFRCESNVISKSIFDQLLCGRGAERSCLPPSHYCHSCQLVNIPLFSMHTFMKICFWIHFRSGKNTIFQLFRSKNILKVNSLFSAVLVRKICVFCLGIVVSA